MIVIDTSVWIDYFRGVVTPQSDKLDTLLGVEQVLTGELILTEVLQGFVSDRDFNQAWKLLASVPLIPLVGEDIAFQAARNFRKLRALGMTSRKTTDTLIATSCIEKQRLPATARHPLDRRASAIWHCARTRPASPSGTAGGEKEARLKHAYVGRKLKTVEWVRYAQRFRGVE